MGDDESGKKKKMEIHEIEGLCNKKYKKKVINKEKMKIFHNNITLRKVFSKDQKVLDTCLMWYSRPPPWPDPTTMKTETWSCNCRSK